VPSDSHPLDFIGKIFSSTIFLSVILVAIASLMVWAIWRG
jgi:hypothetical protein